VPKPELEEILKSSVPEGIDLTKNYHKKDKKDAEKMKRYRKKEEAEIRCRAVR